jgi:hypothetical protein
VVIAKLAYARPPAAEAEYFPIGPVLRSDTVLCDDSPWAERNVVIQSDSCPSCPSWFPERERAAAKAPTVVLVPGGRLVKRENEINAIRQ